MNSPLQRSIAIEIGGISIVLRMSDSQFAEMVRDRYAGFADGVRGAALTFEVDLIQPSEQNADDDLEVGLEGTLWKMRRGDFSAEFDPKTGFGTVRQAANPYALDSVLRISHSLLLAKEGGFLLHAASAIRNGKAFLFSGVSGAGKTTISRLAPADAILLTDEVSYVRRDGTHYRAYGTPFAGELARLGTNCSAPLEAVYILCQGPENKIDDMPRAEGLRALLRNTLFFAHDADAVEQVFQSACAFVESVPIRELTFLPEPSVWELIG